MQVVSKASETATAPFVLGEADAPSDKLPTARDEPTGEINGHSSLLRGSGSAGQVAEHAQEQAAVGPSEAIGRRAFVPPT